MTERRLLVLEPFRSTSLDKMRKALNDRFIIKQMTNGFDEEELKEELKKAEIVIGQPSLSFLQNPEVNCSKLKLIQMTCAGTDMYTRGDLRFPADRIFLANASGTYGMIMSQFVVGMILSLMLNFKDYHTQQQNRIWEKRGPIQSLDHAKVLIYGAGDIGTAIAKRLIGFDAYCIGVCQNTEKPRAYFRELCVLEDAWKYLPDVDVVIGCIPNTKETEEYSSILMPRKIYFVILFVIIFQDIVVERKSSIGYINRCFVAENYEE